MHTAAMERPTSEQIAALPPYPALPLDRIHVLRDAAQCEFAARELQLAGQVGFDTESKPMFVAAFAHQLGRAPQQRFSAFDLMYAQRELDALAQLRQWGIRQECTALEHIQQHAVVLRRACDAFEELDHTGAFTTFDAIKQTVPEAN